MALIDDLLERVTDRNLREDLASAIAALRKSQRFGLVFEAHVPETLALPDLPIKKGALVRPRSSAAEAIFRVLSSNGSKSSIESLADGAKTTIASSELLVVKRFGDPVFPSLESLHSVRNGPAERPYHAIVNGENFHVLQLLIYLYDKQVDCIYIDPPYNSGARDWKYNNRYVDNNDDWRHSKWLSFMQKRLALAKRLLKPDGVLVVTIDKNEQHHLSMLLEKQFDGYDLTAVTIVQNPRGAQGDNFSYTNEFAIFVTPHSRKVISERLLPPDEQIPSTLRNWGGESLRTDARNCFYPIIVKDGRIVGFGEVPDDSYHPEGRLVRKEGGAVEYWPIDRRGVERKWRYARQSVEAIKGQLSVKEDERNSDIILTKDKGKHKTAWWGPRYDANTYGTQVVRKLTGGEFPYPKSVLAVRDTLYACVADKPDALILDFFAGSGTTFHATCLLNHELGGSRRCILVTNNEVSDSEAKALKKKGLLPGDREYEAQGIFEDVTMPRCVAVVTGTDRNGQVIDGELEGLPYSNGFAENIEFLRVKYLDPDEVDLGTQFEAIVRSLWLAAGAVGTPESKAKSGYSIPNSSNYAVLLDDRRFRDFRAAISDQPRIKKVWLVTDSLEAFTEMRSKLPDFPYVSMLYRDYLRNFTINTRLAL